MPRNMTLHIINSIPWSNLNRDDTGSPKRLNQGGVLRGQLSSQSIKRAARVDYEAKSQDKSVRSTDLAEAIVERVAVLSPDADAKEALKRAKEVVGKLTKGEAKEGDKGRSAWLSGEELEAAAQRIVSDEEGDIVDAGRTGSLAIAAFGRMFANAPGKGTEAAISVSPAVSTHAAMIETDYFSTVDDRESEERGAGASFLGIAQFTTGVFYRTVTIDKEQLRKSWSAFDHEESQANLKALVAALVYDLPRGKANSTAPYVMPALVLAEEQSYRFAYDFETPVVASGDGGYLAASIERLGEQRQSALQFDPDNFGQATAVAGVGEDLSSLGVSVTNLSGLVDVVVKWIQQ